MDQAHRDKIFLYHLKQMIADYGGRDVLSNVLILENPEAFDYIKYNDAKKDELAEEVFKKKGARSKAVIIEQNGKKINWSKEHEELFNEYPEAVKNNLTTHQAYYRRKRGQLNIPIRQKSA